jgi:hypothetical protein
LEEAIDLSGDRQILDLDISRGVCHMSPKKSRSSSYTDESSTTYVNKIAKMQYIPDYIYFPHEFFASCVHMINIRDVTERRGKTLGTRCTYQNKKKYPDQHVSGNI